MTEGKHDMKVNVNQVNVAEGKGTLSFLLKDNQDGVLRDSYVLIGPENSKSQTLTFGNTIIYPHCRANGHSHDDLEEIYYVIKGQGKMLIGNDEFEANAGDAFYVDFGLFHGTINTSNTPMEIVWVTACKK